MTTFEIFWNLQQHLAARPCTARPQRDIVFLSAGFCSPDDRREDTRTDEVTGS